VNRFRLRRIFWRGAATILVIAALVALAAVVKGNFSDTDGRILGTLAVLLYTGGALLSGLALVERGRGRWLGATLAAASPVALALMLLWVWSWVDEDGDEHHWRLAWSGVLVLLAGLLAATAMLLARQRTLERLAYGAGVLGALAVALSLVAIWQHDPGASLAKALGAFWILAVLAWSLVPVLRRWSPADEQGHTERVLATLGDVELVASRGSVDGVTVEGRPAPGERLVLRKR
jgi:MFS family permease